MNTLKLTDSELEVLFSFYEIGMNTITKDYTESRFDPKTEHHLRQNIHLHMLKDYDVEVSLLGDSKLVLQKMIECIKNNYSKNIASAETKNLVISEIKKVKEEWASEWNSLLNSSMNPINPYRLVNEINNNIDHENTIVTHDAGHPRDQMMPFITATTPGSYIGWGKSTHLGYGIPLMIGAKIAEPDKFCINFMGDGAFGMSGLDIETSQRSGNPITTIVMNNGTMGGYPQNYPQSIEKYQTIKMTGDYAKIAEGMGATGIKVTLTKDIAPALKKAQKLNEDGITVLIEVMTNIEERRSKF